MNTLKNSSDKIQEICDVLKRETLQPAQKEAQEILAQAHSEAKRIKHDAEIEAKKKLSDALVAIEQERNLFQSSLSQAAKQAVEALKQSLTAKLFNREIATMVDSASSSPEVVSQLIKAVVSALDKEGMEANLSVYIPAHLKPADVNIALAKGLLQRLKGESVQVGDFKGGCAVKLEDRRLTLDITDKALKELFSVYLKKPEFRELIFNAG